jgi:hypothetical protein
MGHENVPVRVLFDPSGHAVEFFDILGAEAADEGGAFGGDADFAADGLLPGIG